MIIRRRHTANFTTIGNELFEDKRLALDEIGLMAYLMSRPNDWEVRRPALARQWRVGRVTIKRMLLNLIRTGWIIARKIRLANGTFHTLYEVRDEPGIELSMDDAKAATSLVWSDADDGEDVGNDPADQPVTGTPDTGQPGVGHPGVVDMPWTQEKNLPNTDSESTESTNVGCDFARVKAAWPIAHILSTVAAEAAFVGLSDSQQTAAFQGIKPYLADCKTSTRKVCDLTTYLRERRWERFASGQPTQGQFFEIRPGTPQWYRWLEHYEEADEGAARLMRVWGPQGRSRWERSEWPPTSPKSESGGTDPPLSEDETYFAEHG